MLPLAVFSPLKAAVEAGSFPLVAGGEATDFYLAENDWTVARIAATDLVEDVERVTGVRPRLHRETEPLGSRAVLIGTIGRSPVIDQLIEAGQLDVEDVVGQWETFVIAAVENPLPGMQQALVVAGSDRRGTAYGAYELSRRIGVSPWYWWADVTQ